MSPIHDPRWQQARKGRAAAEAQAAASAATLDYVKPAVIAGVCAAIILWSALSRGADDVMLLLGVYGLVIGVNSVMGFVALLISAKLWLGGIDNLPLTAVRLIAVASVQMLVGAIVGGGLIGIGINVLVIAGMLTWLFEMEFQDALIVTVILVVMNIAVSMVVVALLLRG